MTVADQYPSEERRQLDRLMGERRVELGLKWRDVAKLAGITTETLRQARYGIGETRPLTKGGIERALRWKSGSVDAILTGGEPTPLPPPGTASGSLTLSGELLRSDARALPGEVVIENPVGRNLHAALAAAGLEESEIARVIGYIDSVKEARDE